MTNDNPNPNQKPSSEELKGRKIAVACGLFVGAVIGATTVGLLRPQTEELLVLSPEQARNLIEKPMSAFVRFQTTGFRIVDVAVNEELV